MREWKRLGEGGEGKSNSVERIVRSCINIMMEAVRSLEESPLSPLRECLMSLVQLTFYRTLSLYIYKSLESVKSKTFKIHRLIQADWIAFIFLKTGKMSEEGVLDYSLSFSKSILARLEEK